MTQIFHPATNPFARGTIFGGIFILAALGWAWGVFIRSSYFSEEDLVRSQPVPFSHAHHVGGLGIDCRYCHTSVEESGSAGMPATEVCMGCHSVIWNESEMLAPVRESYRTGRPLEWTRVHDVPDFVYFNHAVHVNKGVSCQQCHGDVDRMPLMYKDKSLFMEWCLECHMNPEKFVGPRDDVLTFFNSRKSGSSSAGGHGIPALEGEQDLPLTRLEGGAREAHAELIEKHGIAENVLSDCWICHR